RRGRGARDRPGARPSDGGARDASGAERGRAAEERRAPGPGAAVHVTRHAAGAFAAREARAGEGALAVHEERLEAYADRTLAEVTRRGRAVTLRLASTMRG